MSMGLRLAALRAAGAPLSMLPITSHGLRGRATKEGKIFPIFLSIIADLSFLTCAILCASVLSSKPWKPNLYIYRYLFISI